MRIAKQQNFEEPEKPFSISADNLDREMDSIFSSIPEERISRLSAYLPLSFNIQEIIDQDPDRFMPSHRFFAHNDGRIEYIPEQLSTNAGRLKFLHEYSHILLKHSAEVSDVQNLEQEKEAWWLAVQMLKSLNIQLDDQLKKIIISSLASYQDHLSKKRVCIACGSKNVQEYAPQRYTCKDCWCDW